MSNTIIDMPKVTQMLDAKWIVKIWKNDMGSYSAKATHGKPEMIETANRKLIASAPRESRDIVAEDCKINSVITDDFTPEQALTRLSYKVHGEII